MNLAIINKYYILHIKSVKHNLFFNLTDQKGNTKFIITGGMFGHYGKKIKSRLIFQNLLFRTLRKIKRLKIKIVNIQIKNLKTKPYRLLKEFKIQNIRINRIRDLTQVQHGGCKLPRKRR